jgi:hypothetical protein
MTSSIQYAYETALVMADALDDDERVLTGLLYLQAFLSHLKEHELSHDERRHLAEVVQGQLLGRGPGKIDQRIAGLAIEVLGETHIWLPGRAEMRKSTRLITELDMRSKGMSEPVKKMWRGVYGR